MAIARSSRSERSCRWCRRQKKTNLHKSAFMIVGEFIHQFVVRQEAGASAAGGQ